MELTKEKLIEFGFETNHPEYALNKWYKKSKNPEWRIMVEQEYLPLSNFLSYNVSCWLCNNKGAIIKRASLSDVRTVEDLQQLIYLCNIDCTFNAI